MNAKLQRNFTPAAALFAARDLCRILRAAVWLLLGAWLLVRPAGAQITVTYNNGDDVTVAHATGGANDPTTLTIALGSAVEHGAISGPGSVIKAGAGTLTLAGSNNYTGDTTVAGGTLALTVASAAVSATHNLIVGDTTVGTLTLAGGAQFSTTDQIIVGFNAGSAGSSAVVTGTGTLLRTDTFFQVGNAVAARVDIIGGAHADGLNLLLGANPGGDGTLAVAGTGSLFTSADLARIGGIGAGHVVLTNGGRMSSNFIHVGTTATATGTASVDGAGSRLSFGNELNVGHDGTGNVSVAHGGEVTGAGTVFVGRGSTASGTIAVDGAGSLFHTDAGISVGTSGHGQINVTSGGQITTSTNLLVLGENAGATGSVSVMGADSRLTVNANPFLGVIATIVAGDGGDGTLTIGNGGVVETDGVLRLAANAGSIGTVNLNAGGTLVAWGFDQGSGHAVINLAGGTLKPTAAVDSDAPVTVSGTTSTIDTGGTNAFFHGEFSGTGSFTKAGDGDLILDGAITFTGTSIVNGGRLRIFATPAVAQTIVVNSGGSFELASGMTLPAGSTITLNAGSTGSIFGVLAGGAVNLASGSTLILDGATAAGHTITVGNGATLAGTGTINGTVIVLPGGTIANSLTRNGPTNIQSVSTLTPGSASGVTWDGSTDGSVTAAFALRDPAATADRLTLTGTFARGSGSTFKFDFGGTGHATVGNPTTYTLVSFSSTTFANRFAFSYANLPSGLTGAFSLTGNALLFTVTADNTPPVVTAIRRFFPAGSNTAAERVRFQVIFSEAVTGVDAGDFVLNTTGTATGTISAVIGSGPLRYVDVTGISGEGRLRLDLKASGTGIADLPANPIVTGFTGGDTYVRFSTMTAVAWGVNTFGALGDGTQTTASTPVAIDVGALGGKSFAALFSVSSSISSHGLSADGKVYGWGRNQSGTVGDGTTNLTLVPKATNLAALAGKAIVSLAGENNGASSVVHAIASDGQHFAWGQMSLLSNPTVPDSPVPVAMDLGTSLTGKTIVAIVSTSGRNAVLTADGLVFEWQGTQVVSAVDTTGVLADKAVIALSVGGGHKLALTSDGGLYAWGSGSVGKLGNGSTASSAVPVAVDVSGVLAGKTIVAVAAGNNHSVVLTADGRAYAWGRGACLGRAGTSDSAVPVAVDMSGALAGKTIVALTAIGDRTEALTSDGQIFAWGLNFLAGTTPDTDVPVRIVADGALAGRSVGVLGGGTAGISFALADPLPPAITNVAAPVNASYRAGQALDFALTFDGAVTVSTAGGTPSLPLTIGATARQATYVSGSGTTLLTFRYTVAAGDNDSDGIAVAAAVALNGGTLRDANGRDAAPAFTAPATAAVLVDTLAPAAPSVPDLAAASDSGASNTDNLTSVSTPTFTGTAEAGSTVQLFRATNILLGTAVATGGNWSIVSAPLPDGTFSIAARATDAAGNTSVSSGALAVTISTSTPVITSANTATAAVGQAFSYNIAAAGAISFGATGLPPGLGVNPATGAITGTPAAGGAFNVMLTATGANGQAGTGALALEVSKLPAQIVLGNLAQVYDGRPKAATITTTPGNLPLNVLYQSMPDGNVVGAPTNPGTYRVLVSVSDPSYSGGALATLTILPAIATVPQKATAAPGGSATFTAAAAGGAATYQWKKNGVDVPGATSATLTLNNVQPGDVGFYAVVVTSGGVSTASAPVSLELSFTGKIAGAATEVGTDIRHPNGNIYDQVLLSGAAASVKADPGQVTRVSFLDLTNDIVQVEFGGAGVLTLALDGATGPAPAMNYNQPTVAYMKGHATITITGADATTNLGIFSVGRATAVNQALFREGVTYDGWADIALVSIASTDGQFGGVRTGNVSYFATKGLTGISAPAVTVGGPVVLGDLRGSDAANAVLIFGGATDTSVAGGDLLQGNGGAVEVDGLTKLRFTAGADSHNRSLPAQPNRARLMHNGVDVTAQIVGP